MKEKNFIEKSSSIFDETNAGALLLLNESNMHYFCNFSPSEGVVLITKHGKGFHIVDSRYTECAQVYAKETGLQVIEIKNKFETEVSRICKEERIKSIAFEDETISLKEYKKYKEATRCKFIGIGKKLTEIRNIKTPSEIEKMKKANEIAEESFNELLEYITVGQTEKDLAARFDYIMSKNGSDGVSFDTILLTGAHTSLPHGVPGDERIKRGDFVLFDFGATYMGYHSDMTRTIAIGNVTDEMKEDYALVLKAQIAGINALKAGAKCKDVYMKAYDVLEERKMGKYFRHSLGHGIGLDIHEGYNASSKSKETFKAGNVTSIEPGIYMPNKYGIRIEDMCLVTEDGVENLSHVTKDLIIM